MNEFRNSDKAYFAWLARNPTGYVLNVRKEPDTDYVVLHRATCWSISSTKHRLGAYTERGFRKWCAGSTEELRAAAKLEGRKDGTFSKRCSVCGA